MNSVVKPVVHGSVDGNAFAILGVAKKALIDAGEGEKVQEMTDRAMSGDYNHLLSTVMEYVDFDLSGPEDDEDDDDSDDDYESDWEEEDDDEDE